MFCFSSFGVNENFLKVVFANLNALLSLQFHPNDLMSFLQPIADVDKYEKWQQNQGHRPEVWQTTVSHKPESSIPPPFGHRPSVIGLLAGIRLQSRIHSAETGFGSQRPQSRVLSSHEQSASAEETIYHQTTSLGRGTDAGWGDSTGVEAYPKSTVVGPLRRLHGPNRMMRGISGHKC